MKNIFNFTKASITNINCQNKIVEYTDIQNKNLKLVVSPNGNKIFYFRKKYSNRDYKKKVGTFPTMTVDIARSLVNELALKVEKGENINIKKENFDSLGNVFEKYKEYYMMSHNRTEKQFDKALGAFILYLSPYFDKAINEITKEIMSKIFKDITKKGYKYQANSFFRTARAFFNYVIDEKKGLGLNIENPALCITKHPTEDRDRFIQLDEFDYLFDSIHKETNVYIKNYFLILLATGCRKNEISALKWEDVDLISKHKHIHISKTKNGKPRNVPIVEDAVPFFKELLDKKQNEYVFYSNTEIGHVVDLKNAWKRIIQRAGIKNLRIHDLRRTVGSYEAIMGNTETIIGKSLGHKSLKSTEIYARLNLGAIKNAMEDAASVIFKKDPNDLG